VIHLLTFEKLIYQSGAGLGLRLCLAPPKRMNLGYLPGPLKSASVNRSKATRKGSMK
jgi:hypothetical protein